MEHRLFEVDGTPAQEVRLGQQVAAFVEIGCHLHPVKRFYLMEEQS